MDYRTDYLNRTNNFLFHRVYRLIDKLFFNVNHILSSYYDLQVFSILKYKFIIINQ